MELSTAQIIELLDDLAPAGDAPERLNLDKAHILKTLLETDIELQGMMPWSSNYTFLISLAGSDKTEIVVAKESGGGVPGEGEVITIEGPLAIYKPCRGERPLWDFPDGKLCYREFAAYLISETLGWPLIPPTVLRRDAPHGPGTIQFYIQADYDAHYFNLRENRAFDDTFQKIAVFDFIINNADRKGGHCLLDDHHHIWAIDHGLTFHTDYKLRTVIWDYCDDRLPAGLMSDLQRLRNLVDQPRLCRILEQLITPAEIRAFEQRIDLLLKDGQIPRPRYGRNIPYPPI